MKNLSQILRALMDESGLSESELARRTQVGQPVIHRILSGETDNPRVATLSQIANYFTISISQLIGDSPLPTTRLKGTSQLKAPTWSFVPLLNWEQVVHWPIQLENLSMVSTDLPLNEEQGFALTVRDNTMSPRFPEGILLIVDPNRPAKNRDFAIIHIQDQPNAVFKQVLTDGEDLYLKPLNPDFKTTLVEKDRCRILGTVIQAKENL